MPNPTTSKPPAESEQRITLDLSLTDGWILWTQLRLALDQPFNADGRHVDRSWWIVRDLEKQLFGPLFEDVEGPFEEDLP